MIDGTICPKCGKEFFPYPNHAYTANGKRYCCWTCYLHRNEKKKRKNYKVVEQYTLDGKFVRSFDSVNKAAEFMGCCPTTISEACRGLRESKARKFIWKYKSDV